MVFSCESLCDNFVQSLFLVLNSKALSADPKTESNFFTQQVRLQIEARMALSQAKDMAHMQMEVGLINKL